MTKTTVDLVASGALPELRSVHDEWFAWRPVRLGALGTGRLVWFRRLWRNQCAGVTIYQPLGKK
jgi:hypothetical protein